MTMITERCGLIVWINDIKAARNLDRYGSLHYISKKMYYAVLYIHAHKYEEILRQLQRLPYVKKVERSYRNEIKTEYNKEVSDKTRFYTL
ncbi:hypothetical protein PL1_0903 [Paenibacillus larvae subsp. larvae B-3650]|nr:hypothetical protein PL1_0903 [Paenibacillus larvae subsp. larvae B-3650]